MSVTSKPSRASSQAVNRAPCRNGRVSHATTLHPLARRARGAHDAEGRAAAARGQRAGVAVREDVRAVGDRDARRILPIAQHAATSSGGSRAPRRRDAPRVALRARHADVRRCRARPMRSSAHARLTAVGRVSPSRRVASFSDPTKLEASSLGSRSAASASPYAAATPMAGAPRTCIDRMACATSSAVRQRTRTVSRGRRV